MSDIFIYSLWSEPIQNNWDFYYRTTELENYRFYIWSLPFLRLPLQRGVPVVHRSRWSDLPGVRPHQAGRGRRAGDAFQADEGPRVPDPSHPQQGRQPLHPGTDAGLRGPILEHGTFNQRHRAPSGLCQLLLAPGLLCRHQYRALHKGGGLSAGRPQSGTTKYE